MKTICVLTLALALASCSKTTPGPKIDPALASLIPPDTTLLVGVRLDDLQKTSLYKKHLANRPIPLVDDFPQQIGLQIRREDLWELLVISNGKQSVVLGRGKFANEAEPRIEIPGATRFGHGGYTLVGDERQAVLLISPSLIGFGPTPALRSLIDNKGKSNGPPGVLADQIKQMPAEAVLWAAYGGGITTLPFDLPGDMANFNRIIASIQFGSAYFDLRAGVNGLATGTSASEQDAKSLYDTLRAFVGIGRMMVPQGQPGRDQKERSRIFDGLRVTQESRKVNIHIEEPEEVVDTFVELLLGQGTGRAK